MSFNPSVHFWLQSLCPAVAGNLQMDQIQNPLSFTYLPPPPPLPPPPLHCPLAHISYLSPFPTSLSPSSPSSAVIMWLPTWTMELNCAVELPVDINIDIFLMFTFVFLYP